MHMYVYRPTSFCSDSFSDQSRLISGWMPPSLNAPGFACSAPSSTSTCARAPQRAGAAAAVLFALLVPWRCAALLAVGTAPTAAGRTAALAGLTLWAASTAEGNSRAGQADLRRDAEAHRVLARLGARHVPAVWFTPQVLRASLRAEA